MDVLGGHIYNNMSFNMQTSESDNHIYNQDQSGMSMEDLFEGKFGSMADVLKINVKEDDKNFNFDLLPL